MKLSQITVLLAEGFTQWLLTLNLSPKTINNYILQLRAMFNKAIAWGYAYQNPFASVSLMKVMKKTHPRFLDKPDLRKLLKVCSERLRRMILFIVFTGVRIGELANLTWNDVDFKRKVVIIQAKEDFKPKDYEVREIDMHPAVVKILREMRKTSRSAYIFTSPGGVRLDANNALKRQLKPAAVRAGVDFKGFGWNTFRHCFGSYLSMAGMDLMSISGLMGHSEIKTTANNYLHLSPGHKRKGVGRIRI